ncbi:hypothetical protein IJH72_00865 [Candidatus Saccharibacteria bacterium]|nr:hypothetical protein [Candidatus Saccharibacteria bacterium]MBR0372482.1 hypothetical protein [Candidatus Saccharibacteria bacterium]
MKMEENHSTFKIPSFARSEVYDFDASKDTLEVFKELNAISEEIESCRLRNC